MRHAAHPGRNEPNARAPTLALERQRIPVMSAGGILRANLAGRLVVELFYAYPFQRPEAGWQFGFQISPGW